MKVIKRICLVMLIPIGLIADYLIGRIVGDFIADKW